MYQHDLDIHYPRTPTNFISHLGTFAEKVQLTQVLRAQGGLYEHAGEEMLDYLGLTRSRRNLAPGPSLQEAGL